MIIYKGPGEGPRQVPVHALLMCSPFDNCVWDTLKSPITRNEIAKALSERTEIQEGDNSYWEREQHIAQIAYFVENPSSDPISVDVGCPSLHYYRDWLVTDGHHRLAAAIFRGDETILADVSGQIDYAEELFGPHPGMRIGRGIEQEDTDEKQTNEG